MKMTPNVYPVEVVAVLLSSNVTPILDLVNATAQSVREPHYTV